MKTVDFDFEKIYRDYKKRYYRHMRPHYPWYITFFFWIGCIIFGGLVIISAKLPLVWSILVWLAGLAAFGLFTFLALRYLNSKKESMEKIRKRRLRWKCLFVKGYLHRNGLLKAPYIDYLASCCDNEKNKPSILNKFATVMTVFGPSLSMVVNMLTNTTDNNQTLNSNQAIYYIIASFVLSLLCIAFLPLFEAMIDTLLKQRRSVCADLRTTLAILEANL